MEERGGKGKRKVEGRIEWCEVEEWSKGREGGVR